VARLQVLLIDDNETNIFVAQELLRAAQCDVVSAKDGQTGVDIAFAHEFDLILLDINMPTLNGWDAATQVRASNRSMSRLTPIYVLTGNVRPDHEAKALEAGVQGVLSKPLRAKQLELILALVHKMALSNNGVTPVPNLASSGLDQDVISELRDILGPDLLKTHQQKFVTEMLSDRGKILGYFRVGHFQEASQISHRLMGSALVYGAKSMASLLSKIEESVSTLSQDTLEKHLSEISRLIRVYEKWI
jgi:CheY-like chemotaxis protein